MAQPTIQTSFHAGEWAPALGARVDLAKYHSAAALIKNWFVDYRGGVSTRPGTRYVLHGKSGILPSRLIPFQLSLTTGYILEFGNNYLRFYLNGGPVLETAKAITGASQANPCQLTITSHGYAIGDWIFVTGVVGMTQLNGRYFIVKSVVDANNITITDLVGANVNSTAYTAYSSGGTAARVYQITTPFGAGDLAKLKFAQNVGIMVLTHPNYAPQLLTFISSANWTLAAISVGPQITPPTGVGITTTLAAGNASYGYAVTAVDANGRESAAATASLASKTDLRSTPGTNQISWSLVAGALSYNVYKAEITYSGTAPPSGAAYGFIGNCVGTVFNDSNIDPDFSTTPPIVKNPFLGGNVTGFTVTAAGTYTSVPNVTVAAPSPPGTQATATASLGVTVIVLVAGGSAWQVGDIANLGNGVTIQVLTVDGAGAILTFSLLSPGSITAGGTPTNPVTATNPHLGGANATFNLTWGVTAVFVLDGGSGYTSAPAVTFSAGAATATSFITLGAGNPGVPGFFQQRLYLCASTTFPQSFNASQPGSFFNFNISNPLQEDDAISGTLAAGVLNEIKALVPMPSGLIIFTNRSAWLLNGGSAGSGISATNPVANPHSYNGASDIPPIVANFDILYVQAKGSIVRDLTFDFYKQIFTGTDISVLSSHLFYGFTLREWAWAEEPYKLVWAVRSDGTMLTLTFLKEQDLIGWTQHTTNGKFKSVATVTETVTVAGVTETVDAVYTLVQRTVNGNTVVYIERVAERLLNGQAKNAWAVDAGLQYNGSPATSFSGAEHLAGMTVTGLADGVVIPPFTMPVSGQFTLSAAASVVTVGLAFTPQLQTLPLDLGEPTVQGKRKKVTAYTVRCQEALGLTAGRTFGSAVPMKDLVVGNVGTMTNQVVTDLVTGDTRLILDPLWDVPGQVAIQQPQPLPATILGVIPEIAVGDIR